MSLNKRLNIKIFADGVDLNNINDLLDKDIIKGYTTNPSLMKKSGIKDYKKFVESFFEVVKNNNSISLEVFSDDFQEMELQAKKIHSWKKNIYIKIPITNSKGESSEHLIKKLSDEGIPLNITAVFTKEQIHCIKRSINKNSKSIISIFAGRIADTGMDPIPFMKESINYFKDYINAEILWASTRELLNIFQANDIGCHIITVTCDIINKLNNIGKDLSQYSLETVSMFRKDAVSANLKI